MEDDQGLIDAFKIVRRLARIGIGHIQGGTAKEQAALKLFEEFIKEKAEFSK